VKKTVVGLGEILWDMLPGDMHLGGAPANFAYITRLLGDEGIVASRIGSDPLGDAAKARMEALGLSTSFLQKDAVHPTGVVDVEVDAAGNPRFNIAASSAWDYLEWTEEWKRLAEKSDAICFGSLAQRSPQSRDTIYRFVGAMRPEAVRVCDLNLRPPFYSAEILNESMKLADIVKMNDDELPEVMSLAGFPHQDEKSSALRLVELFDLRLACVTRGCKGSLLMSRNDYNEQPGFLVKVADTVGAGDAFTATLVHEFMRGDSLAIMNEKANAVGAWVASQVGATPAPKDGILERLLAGIF